MSRSRTASTDDAADARAELVAIERRLSALREARAEIEAAETALGRLVARIRVRLGQSPDGRCVGS